MANNSKLSESQIALDRYDAEAIANSIAKDHCKSGHAVLPSSVPSVISFLAYGGIKNWASRSPCQETGDSTQKAPNQARDLPLSKLVKPSLPAPMSCHPYMDELAQLQDQLPAFDNETLFASSAKN
jgi:hypothetical protein